MISGFQACIFGTVLVRSVTGENSGDIEYYGSFLKCQRVLRRSFLGKRIVPIGIDG